MRTRTKILISFLSVLIVMLLLPMLAVHVLQGDDGMAVAFLLFFAVDPTLAVLLGILAGSEWRRLWWIPPLTALSLPFLFSLTVGEMVWDLFIYAAICLLAGMIPMLLTAWIRASRKEKKE